MPPQRAATVARAKAKAKAAAAALTLKNTRRDSRREACKSLNALALELQVPHAQVCVKAALAPGVETLVRLLEKRVRTAQHTASLRAAAALYLNNGGVFSAPLLDPSELLPPAVPKHRVLLPTFVVSSWMRVRLARSTPQRSWLETREQYGQRLKRCCAEVNADCDVEGLSSAFPKRIKMLKDREGGRLPK